MHLFFLCKSSQQPVGFLANPREPASSARHRLSPEPLLCTPTKTHMRMLTRRFEPEVFIFFFCCTTGLPDKCSSPRQSQGAIHICDHLATTSPIGCFPLHHFINKRFERISSEASGGIGKMCASVSTEVIPPLQQPNTSLTPCLEEEAFPYSFKSMRAFIRSSG